MNNKIYVAKLGKSIGLKGDIKIYIDSDFPEQFKSGATFTTNKKQILTISKFNKANDTVHFEGIDTIEDVKKLTNQLLYTSLEDTKSNCELEDKQYFWFDLVDCSIYENNELLGFIKDIHRYPLDDYFEINTDTNLINKELPKSFLLPYNENYIINVDLENKKIDVKDAKAILENS